MDDMSVIAYLNRSFMTTQKPLDVQIQEMRDYLTEYVLEASDMVYLETGISLTWTYYDDGNVTLVEIPKSVAINASGQINLTFLFKPNGYDSLSYFYVYKNSEEVGHYADSSTTRTITIDVEKGDIITFKYTATKDSNNNAEIYLSDVNILAVPLYARELDLIEVTEEE